jgi:hypothetical protein
MEFPRISVVTPCYNAADTIEETIRSVLDQDYPNLEYIVVDGGSDDNTRNIIEKYSDRLHWWVSEPDGGQYAAVVKGFEKASGTIFYWINADDKMLSHTFQIVAEIFESLPQVDWLSTLYPIVFDESGAIAAVNPIPAFDREAFLRGRYVPGYEKFHGFIQQESTFFKADLWRKSFHVLQDYPLAGDFALWGEMYRHAELFGCQYPFCGFRARAGQRSQDLEQYVAEAHTALETLRRDVGWDLTFAERGALASRSRKLQRWAKQWANPLAEVKTKVVMNQDLRQQKRQWTLQDRLIHWL